MFLGEGTGRIGPPIDGELVTLPPMDATTLQDFSIRNVHSDYPRKLDQNLGPGRFGSSNCRK